MDPVNGKIEGEGISEAVAASRQADTESGCEVELQPGVEQKWGEEVEEKNEENKGKEHFPQVEQKITEEITIQSKG